MARFLLKTYHSALHNKVTNSCIVVIIVVEIRQNAFKIFEPFFFFKIYHQDTWVCTQLQLKMTNEDNDLADKPDLSSNF